MERLPKLYAVPVGSRTHKTIRRVLKEREAAALARVALIERLFPTWRPGSKWSTWSVVWDHSRSWGVIPPENRQGFCFQMPSHWRRYGRTSVYVPNLKTKAGREVAKEMAADQYVIPSQRAMCDQLGIDPYLGGGLLHHVLHEISGRRFVLQLHADQVPPADCPRISDIEFEAMLPKLPKRWKAVAR